MAFGCFVWSSLCVQSYNCHDLKPNTLLFFFFQAEDGRRDGHVTGVQTCALPISKRTASMSAPTGAGPEAAIVSAAAIRTASMSAPTGVVAAAAERTASIAAPGGAPAASERTCSIDVEPP